MSFTPLASGPHCLTLSIEFLRLPRLNVISDAWRWSFWSPWSKAISPSPGGHPKCSTYGHPNCPTRPPALAATVPVASSLCEPHREFIEAQLRLKRNAVAIFQDLVDTHGFAGQPVQLGQALCGQAAAMRRSATMNPSRLTDVAL